MSAPAGMERTLAQLSELLDGELIGDGSTVIRGLNGTSIAQADELTFAEDPHRLADALAGPAGAILVPPDITDLQGRSGIRVASPRVAFARLLALYYPAAAVTPGIHATAVVGRNVRFGAGVAVGPYAVVGDDVVLGDGTSLGASVVLGDGTRIGRECVVDAHVTIYRHTAIGDRVLIHAGAVLGGDGFGYVFDQGRHVKIPQVGNVVIEDDVEIGCNVCVDRATIGSTVIRQGTKLDNLVQIAHNDQIGKHVMMAGQVGLSGSVTVGDYTVLGGKAGVVDHVTLGDRVQVGAASVVTKSVGHGEVVWGYPARPVRMAKRQMAASARLPALLARLTHLLARIRRAEERLDRLDAPRGPGRPAA